MSLSDLAAKIGAAVLGDGTLQVSSAHTLEDAIPGQISFLANPKYEKLLATTRASAVITGSDTRSDKVTLLRHRDPYYAFMQAVVLLHGHRRHPHVGIDPKAHVDPTASIGAGTVLYPGAYVGPRASLGKDCILYPNAVVYDDCILGDRVMLHAGAVIGQDGFGYATHKGVHHKIPQIGNVVIEDDVEVGANVAIQRATLGSTIIGRGTKMSDLISIGHAAKVGEGGLVVSLVGIAGSTRIGHHVTIGGQAGVVGHVNVGNNVMIAAQAGVVNDVPDKSLMYGSPAMPAPQGRKILSLITQLPDLLERIRTLEKKLENLGISEK
ncbi:MAG: UDP-3-O-(3-hydroxymyristoyl)glucosamine N-acyltransferase [Planctomycetota bacterium]|nr:UDP-3-O-(3-hydroxymyristoyl)glucosamine N-acyltransferase [Planctomycetota bacterium]